MWMCYSSQSWPEALNLHSAVERLKYQFIDLEQDAEHESVYGMGRLFDEEYCKQIAEKYRKGVKVCDKYLQTQKCGECLYANLIRLGLTEFVGQIEKFLPRKETIQEESEEEEVESGDSDAIESTSTEHNEAESKN